MSPRDHDAERAAVRGGLVVTAGLCVVEAVGGWLTNSLALLSDAAHMLSDVGALGLTFFALQIGLRRASARNTYGYYRAEILAALVNGVVLWVVVFFIVREAWDRLFDPPQVAGAGMMVVAVAGLLVNVVVARRLHGHAHGSLNLRGAYLHVVADLLGSVGAVVAGLVILTTGWTLADPLVSLAIAVLILFSSWRLVREAVDVLMEAVPAHVDVEKLQRCLEAVPGTLEVHDLHVWSLTTGHCALSAHAVVDAAVAGDDVLAAMAGTCAEVFGIDHVTIQIERTNRRHAEPVH
jgi:cobalt-zinc-cadmium efflux system protein